MKNKKVSVIIPTYNGSEYLSRSIDSVLRQTYKNIEIIVVDDNDPKSFGRKCTEEVMKRYQGLDNIKYLKHKKNMNGSAARNTGINAAEGEYIAFLDDDDIYMPDKVQECVEIINKENTLCVFCDVAIIKDNMIVAYVKSKKCEDYFYELFTNENMLGSGSNLFLSKNAIETNGLFDETLVRNQDYEYMLRLFSKTNFVSIINKCLVVKIHKTTNNRLQYETIAPIKEKLINTFSNEINEYEINMKNNILFTQHRILYEVAKTNGDEKNSNFEKEYLKKINEIEFNRISNVLTINENNILLKVYRKIKYTIYKTKYANIYKNIESIL